MPTDGSADHFDPVVEHAVRAFQQQRGLITDGIVGPATYRALREAGWTLGDRMLALLISTPMCGDDVVALQERLLELGYDTGRPSGVFDEQTERGAARVPARLRRSSRTASAGRRRCARCASSAPSGQGRPPAPAARAGAAAPGRPPLARQADRDRPRSRRPGPRRDGGRRHGGRPDVGPRPPARGTHGRDRHGGPADPPRGRAARPRPSGPRSRTPRAPTSCCRCTSTRTTACTPRGSRPSTSATARASRRRWARRSPATSSAS